MRIENQLLSALPAEESERIRPHVEVVRLEYGRVLFEYGERVRYAYFPLDCVVSLLSVTEDGRSIELAMVGREGMVGLPAFLGADLTFHSAAVQVPGAAVRFRARVLREMFERRAGPLAGRLSIHVWALLAQVSRLAACNRYHRDDERVARWLLMIHDRTGADDLLLSHEHISLRLGMRRPGVTEVLGGLKRAGIVETRRSAIRLLDRAGLEGRSCECYRRIAEEVGRPFSHRAPETAVTPAVRAAPFARTAAEV